TARCAARLPNPPRPRHRRSPSVPVRDRREPRRCRQAPPAARPPCRRNVTDAAPARCGTPLGRRRRRGGRAGAPARGARGRWSGGDDGDSVGCAAMAKAATVPLPITGDPAADQLLGAEPFALLMGMLLDQQVPMEWAFRGPATLRERLGGRLDATAV